jgi:hypothetical protein
MKAKILQAAQERLRQLKAAIQKARPKIVQEALDLFEMGLDEELVYEEIRDRYVDSVPLLAGKSWTTPWTGRKSSRGWLVRSWSCWTGWQ